ncbi:MAG: hypothetical protein ACJ8R9_18270 [Steroidobacteraceae bacterium]
MHAYTPTERITWTNGCGSESNPHERIKWEDMKVRTLGRVLLFVFGIGASALCAAYELGVAHVTTLQSTYMPTNVQFTVDTGTASCPAGHWLTWANADKDNNKATYATLLAAVTSGMQIMYYVNNGDTGCTVIFLNILSTS